MSKWEVMRHTHTPTHKVEADYFTLEQGHLIFRKRYVGPGPGYPETVLVYAPGAWSEVHKV